MGEPFLRDHEGKIREPRCDVDQGYTDEAPCNKPADWVVTTEEGNRYYFCSDCLKKRGFKGIADLDRTDLPYKERTKGKPLFSPELIQTLTSGKAKETLNLIQNIMGMMPLGAISDIFNLPPETVELLSTPTMLDVPPEEPGKRVTWKGSKASSVIEDEIQSMPQTHDALFVDPAYLIAPPVNPHPNRYPHAIQYPHAIHSIMANCQHPYHVPPRDFYDAPGEYEHRCPACGKRTLIRVMDY